MRAPKKKMTKKTAAVATAAVLGLATAGGAYAYWTTTGAGTGTATTGTTTEVSVAQVGSITAMSPGSPAQAIDFTITNPASTNQYIAGVTVAISSVNAPNASSTNTCDGTDFAIVQPTVVPGDLGNGVHTYNSSGATLALIDKSTNQDGCKGATVALSFSANAS